MVSTVAVAALALVRFARGQRRSDYEIGVAFAVLTRPVRHQAKV